MILFNEFKRHHDALREELEDAVKRVFESGWYVLGREGELFEQEFAQYIGVPYCVGVANGTEAIMLALIALGVERGDEVITTSMTAYPTITGIQQARAIPVVVDINPIDGLIDCDAIEQKITSRTKVIIPVHLYGQSCDLDNIKALAKKHDLKIMEDCAQSTGTTYKGHKTGSYGDCASFSFYPTKNLGAYGDGGAITTSDREVYEKLKSLRNYGQTRRYYHDYEGINSRLDEVQAAILRVKLPYLDQWNLRRRDIAMQYRQGLKGVDCLIEHSYGQMNYHLFVIKTFERNQLMAYLDENEIKTLIHYPVVINHQQAFGGQKDEMPNATSFASSILSLPIYPELRDDEVQRIIVVINKYTK